MVLSIVFTFYMVGRNSFIQTLGARMAADYISKQLKTEVRIGGLDLSFTKGLTLEDILVKDKKDQVLISAHKLSVTIRKFNYSQRILSVDKVLVEKGVFQVVTYKGDTLSN
ncbi:MAG: hypothetical protein WCL00_13180, partial [Bacteroidota bacterium]